MATVATRGERFAPPFLWRWTVAQLHAVTEAGILPDGAPIELIDGVLIQKDRSDSGETPGHKAGAGVESSRFEGFAMNHGVRHSMGVCRGPRAMDRATRNLPVHVRIQLPVTLDDFNEPEPDYCLVPGEPEDYQAAHPGAADLLLVVEVADSSLTFDRTTKLRLYASSGIRHYWIVNLKSDCVEVHEDPDPVNGEYRTRAVLGRGETVMAPLPNAAKAPILVDALLCP